MKKIVIAMLITCIVIIVISPTSVVLAQSRNEAQQDSSRIKIVTSRTFCSHGP